MRWSLPSGRGRALVFACALALAAPAARAEDARPEDARPEDARPEDARPEDARPEDARPEDARAEEARGEAPEGAEQIVVLGRRLRGQVSGDPTASATVVAAARFAGEAKSVAELVATAPGVAVNAYGGLGQLATVSIRGATADGVLVLLDGIPLNSAFGGGVDLASIPRHWIDRIEIVRGTEGAYHGSGALGGVVNVVTRRPGAGTWSVEAGAGSFETFSAAADRSLALGPAALLLAAGGESSGGAFPYRYAANPDAPHPSWRTATRANDATARAGGLARIVTGIGAARLDVLAQVSGGGRELPGSAYQLTPGDWQEDARAALAARLSGAASERLLLAAGLSGRFDWLSSRTGLERTSHRGGAAALDGEARLAHGPGLLRVSLHVREEVVRADELGGARERPTFAAALAEDLDLGAGRLRVGPALRVERTGRFSGVSSKLGGSLRLAGPLALRASAGTSFRAPSLAELSLQQALIQPNPALLPEEGVGGDAALVLDAGPVFASVGGHATLYRDLVYYQEIAFGRVKPFNAGKVLARGLEVEVATAPASAALGLSIQLAYTLLATELLRGSPGVVGNEVPHRARHRGYARVAVGPGPAALHLEAHAVGRQFADDANRAVVRRALTLNAGAALRLARRPEVVVALEARNLLDDRTLQDAFMNPLPGRMLLVSLRAGSPPPEGSR